MSWNKRLTPDDNIVIIGIGHPMKYFTTMTIILRQFGQCVVFVPKEKEGFFRDKKVMASDVWSDTLRFLRLAKWDIVLEEDLGDKMRYLVE